jgi:glycosyltransferase involved in cell wall biosynthesis
MGGIATYTLQLGSRLVERGHDVTVYCRRKYLDEAAGKNPPPYQGIKRRLSPGLRGKYLDALSHTFTSALDVLRRDYDLVHLHGSAPGIVLPMLRLRRHLPLVTTIHSLDWEGAKWGGAAAAMMRAAARVPVTFSDALTVVSERLQRYYADEFGTQTTYIPSGVEMPDLRPAEEISRRWGLEENGYVLFVGRLTPEKNLEHLMEAWRELDTSRRLVIVGGVNSSDGYTQRILSQAPDDVIFTDYQTGDTLAELFSNAYIYVQPSMLEGISMSVLEALSYGRCVIASDIPGNVEALGPCGYVFDSGNTEALLSTMQGLLDRPDLVAAQRDRARGHVAANHDWETTADRFDRLFSDLTGRERLSVPESRPQTVIPDERITDRTMAGAAQQARPSE